MRNDRKAMFMGTRRNDFVRKVYMNAAVVIFGLKSVPRIGHLIHFSRYTALIVSEHMHAQW